jgi:hypothetical protein
MINVNLKLFPIVLLDVASQAHRGLAYASPELMQALKMKDSLFYTMKKPTMCWYYSKLNET